ncbi:MAG: hypothetical protein SPJ40_06345 [Oscillospiraceae bacterium]|nr:hypothetical protein [Oscillospiraceae bacterium]
MQSKRRKKAGKIFRLALVITVFVLIIATVVLSAAALIFFRVENTMSRASALIQEIR